MRRGLVTGVLALGVSASAVLPRTTALADGRGTSRLSEVPAEQARIDAPKDPVSKAEAQVAAAKRAANSAAARYAQAESRLATLSNELAQLDRSVASAQRETAKFRDLARERAIDAYRSAGQSNSLGRSRSSASGMDAAMDAVTRRALLARVNGLDSDTASRFAALSEDLERLRGQVASRKEEQRRALADLRAVKRQLDGRLSATVTAQRNLQARLRREASARASTRVASRRLKPSRQYGWTSLGLSGFGGCLHERLGSAAFGRSVAQGNGPLRRKRVGQRCRCVGFDGVPKWRSRRHRADPSGRRRVFVLLRASPVDRRWCTASRPR